MILDTYTAVFAIAIATTSGAYATNATRGDCFSPNLDRGSCIPLKNCLSLKNLLLKRPMRDEDRQFLIKSQCGSLHRTVFVCCTDGHTAEELLVTTTTAPLTTERSVFYEPCTAPNGDWGTCIPLEECSSFYKMALSVQTTNSERLFLKRSQCGYVGRKVWICCPNGDTTTQQPTVTTGATLPDPDIYCSLTISTRIFGGSVAMFDEFPWAALISYDMANEMLYDCGGSLINTRYVLTAAHCAAQDDILEAVVRLGEWNTATNLDCDKDSHRRKFCADRHIDIPIESAVLHPNYVADSLYEPYDIALLRLTTIIQYTEFIKPICLPINENLKNVHLEGSDLEIAGWGLRETGPTNLKQKAVIPVVSLNYCRELYGRFNAQVVATQICVGGKEINSCNGDSGGGAIALDTSDPLKPYNYIAGIISYGPKPCGFPQWPEVLTRVSSFVDWIKDSIRP